MLHFPKAALFSSIAAFTSLFIGSADPSNAQNILELSPSASSAAPDAAAELILVDVHRLLLLDVSGSMKPDEILAAFGGATAYYGSNELAVEQQTAICSANTIIFYGSHPKASETWILCDAEDTAKFEDTLSNIDLEAIRGETGTTTLSTSLTDAFKAAGVVLAAEKGLLNISSMQRNILFISDEYGGDGDGMIDRQRDDLIARYDASISAVAIEDETLTQRFMLHAISTPDVLHNLGKSYIAPGSTYFIGPPGEDEEDTRAQGITHAIQTTFSLARG